LNWERMIALARLFILYPRELTMHPYQTGQHCCSGLACVYI
jgi:hypothetical protein